MIKNSVFADWIKEQGYENLAKKMNVHPGTVRYWRNGHCLPKSKQMRQIKIMSKGTVSYDDMIDRFFDRKKA